MKRELSKAQERRLLRKHCSGDFGSGNWATIRILILKGFIELTGYERFIVTEKGVAYCNEFQSKIKL